VPTTHTLSARTVGRYLVEPAAGAPRGLLVGFHGYGQDESSMMEELQRIPGAAGWTKAAVLALHRFYETKTGRVVASWMTKLDREQAIADNLAYVTNVVSAVRTAHGDLPLVFVGFSQGAAMAWRAAAGRLGARAVVVLGGDLPPDVSPTQGLPPALIGAGSSDTWYTPEKLAADEARLRQEGAAFEVCRFEGGHVWTDHFREAAGRFLASVVV
jgi:predicted esterase